MGLRMSQNATEQTHSTQCLNCYFVFILFCLGGLFHIFIFSYTTYLVTSYHRGVFIFGMPKHFGSSSPWPDKKTPMAAQKLFISSTWPVQIHIPANKQNVFHVNKAFVYFDLKFEHFENLKKI